MSQDGEGQGMVPYARIFLKAGTLKEEISTMKRNGILRVMEKEVKRQNHVTNKQQTNPH